MEANQEASQAEGQEVKDQVEEARVSDGNKAQVEAYAEVVRIPVPSGLLEMVEERAERKARNKSITPAERIEKLQQYIVDYCRGYDFSPGDLVVPKAFYRDPDDPRAERSIHIVIEPSSVPGKNDDPRETLRLAGYDGPGFYQQNHDPQLFEPYVEPTDAKTGDETAPA